MNYITYKRFKTKAICGDVNIPALTEIEQTGSYLFHNGKALCVVTSENAHNYFMRNDDDNGMERGKLIEDIKKALQKDRSKWEKVWNDKICQKYRRTEHADYWLWNHDFYIADIDDLRFIYELISK